MNGGILCLKFLVTSCLINDLPFNKSERDVENIEKSHLDVATTFVIFLIQ